MRGWSLGAGEGQSRTVAESAVGSRIRSRDSASSANLPQSPEGGVQQNRGPTIEVGVHVGFADLDLGERYGWPGETAVAPASISGPERRQLDGGWTAGYVSALFLTSAGSRSITMSSSSPWR